MGLFDETAKAIPGQDPGDTSTSGLGGLAAKAVKKAIDDGTLNTNTVDEPLSNLRSLIVTDPDLVDPELDVSGLRTQTDTDPRLLASIADYPGISYDPTQFSYLTDLNELFAYGLPVVDTGTTTPDTGTGGGGTGDGGQGTVPGAIDTLVTPPDTGVGVNTPEDQRLIDAGIGVQAAPGQPVVAPGEIPYTQDVFDEFNRRPVTPVSPPGQPIDPTGMLPQTSTPYMVEGALGVDPREKMDFVTEEDLVDNRNLLQKLGLPADFDIKRAALEAGINLVAGVPITLLARGLGIGLDALGNILPEGNIAPSTNLARSTGLLQGDNTVTQDIYGINTQTSFDPVQSTINYNEYNVEQVEKLENRLEELKTDKYTKDGVFNEQAYLDNTKRMRQELEDRKEYLDTVNKDPLYGGDIDERDQMLEDIVLQNKIDAGIQAADDDKGDDMLDTSTGVNPFADIDTGVGEFDITPGTGITRPGTGTVLGKPDIEKFDDAETSIDMFDTTPVDTTVTGTLGPPSEISGPQVTEEKPVDIELADNRAVRELNSDQIIEYENLTNQLEGQEMQRTGNPDISISKQEEIKNKAIDQIQDQDIINRGGGDDIGTGGLDPNRGQQVDRGSSGDKDEVGTTITKDTPKQSTYDAELEDERDVGGGGNDGGGSPGGGKIVCTMMNESYGFGSFRNKIWMKFHKDLSPEYQRGYHKLFLPLVKIAKKNIIVKKILEHIAVHSTIDMRQSMRGKTHLLGRIYRKILLPLCYWVGKNG